MTVVTFVDADGDEFPISLIGRYETTGDAIVAANGVLTKAIWEGKLKPKFPITIPDFPYEWGGQL
jgi:hypothetical protein